LSESSSLPRLAVLLHTYFMIKKKYTLKDFLPLIVIFLGICIVSLYVFFSYGHDLMFAARIFMAGFFLVFGLLKLIKLKAFAEAYQMYDVLASRSILYAYLYPFIELGLGFAYAFNFQPTITQWVTVMVMLFSALGVYLQLRKGEKIICACLGTVFKVPMTWVTLFEDLLMAAMAGYMLIVL